MSKLKEFIQKIKLSLTPKLMLVDSKLQTVIPNSKLRKVVYITILTFAGIIFLMIFLALVLSSGRNSNNQGFILNRPKIQAGSPAPQRELTLTEKELSNLKNEINDMKFPESTINIPKLETKITL